MKVAKPKKTPGDYTEEQEEFLRAVEAYRVKTGRRFLRVTDYFRVMQEMGYTRTAPMIDGSNHNINSVL